eukprot:m.36615 g.36615  ORF g.36615 m.36615 type:complete len:313 (-) comp11037_c0_seq2:104-1042(-)
MDTAKLQAPMAGVVAGVVAGAVLTPLVGLMVGVGTLVALTLLLKDTVPLFVDKNKKIELVILEKENITHDVRRIRLQLPTPKHVSGLAPGKHINAVATIKDSLVIRNYTPVSSVDARGYLDLVLKVYFPNERFPEGGKMSQHLNSLAVGDKMVFKGPSGHVSYDGRGVLRTEHKRGVAPTLKRCKRFAMIAGGTGLTPLLSIVRAILKDPSDKTQASLLFANKTIDDVMLKEELDSLAASDDRFSVWYTLDNPPDGWKFSSGFVSAEMIAEHLPPPADTTQVLVCGPPPMVKFACRPNLEKLGFSEAMISEF